MNLIELEKHYKVGSKTAENMQELLLRAGGKHLTDYLLNFAERLKSGGSKELAQIALEVQAPLAGRLNMQLLKKTIENTAFKLVYPKQHDLVSKMLRRFNADTAKDITKIKTEILKLLKDKHLDDLEIMGRTKEPYSLYKKLHKTGNIEGVHDLLALRIIASSVEGCYKALDIIHEHYHPKLNRIKDYISNPKPNGYQSLHTTVRVKGKVVEIQIRTMAMHKHAEGGSAAYWHYDKFKISKGYRKGGFAGLAIFKKPASIYVFSPAGDVFALPKNAGPLDFAFGVHSGVGLRTQGAKVNGHIVKLNSKLKNGDVVEIITGKEAKPKRDWLKAVKSSKAKGNIRTWLRQKESERYSLVGRQFLTEALNQPLPLNLDEVAKQFNLVAGEDLLVAIGAGHIGAETVARKIGEKQTTLKPKPRKPTGTKASKGRIEVSGMEGIDYHFANCCKPAPGEALKGYITQSLGITVHAADCREVSEKSNRLVDCKWA